MMTIDHSATTEIDWESFSRSSSTVETEIELAQSPSVVFAYVTTPALWHTWHPATAQVRGVPMRPLRAGETMLEVIAMMGMRHEALWTVLACAPPQRWEIVTDTPRGSARISYLLTPTPGGCRFHRTLAFRSKGWPWRWFDATLTRAVLVRQSARALRNLAAVLARSEGPHRYCER